MRAQKNFAIACLLALSACGGGGDSAADQGPINSGTLGIERTFACTGAQDIIVRILSNQESVVVTDSAGGNARTFIRLGEEGGFVEFREGSTTLLLEKGVVDNPQVRSGPARYLSSDLTCTLRG